MSMLPSGIAMSSRKYVTSPWVGVDVEHLDRERVARHRARPGQRVGAIPVEVRERADVGRRR
jgi:hypothetical protein